MSKPRPGYLRERLRAARPVPNTDPGICAQKCPECKTPAACLKSKSHVGKTEHWCMNCGNTWPSK